MINILLAEDHEVVRNGIKSLLEQEEDFKVTGEAKNGVEALNLLYAGLKADIVLSDISMPEMDGLELAAKVRRDFQEVKIIILSMMDHENYIFDAFKAGISGYLLKNTNREEMFFSIRQVYAGNQVLCNELSIKMLQRASNLHFEPNQVSAFQELSARELEVLLLTADGYTNNEIADKLFTSRRTVEGHRQHLLEKTGAKNTAALVQLAFRAGILK